MSKSGYEIRADILALAKNYLDQQANLSMEYMKQSVQAGNETYIKMLNSNFMKPYSLEDVMSVAERMYRFVDSKSEK